MKKRRFFITFEGPEGSGKSTHALLLARFFRRSHRRVLLTREPGGSPFAEAIRALTLSPKHKPSVMTELLMYVAARHEHVVKTILPALKNGRVVICDRFSDSTLAYQGYGRGLNVNFIRGLDSAARGGLRPGLTFLLDVPVAVGLKRAKSRKGARGGDRLERESVLFHERVRKGFLALARREPNRIKVIKLKPTIKETFQEILKIVKRHGF